MVTKKSVLVVDDSTENQELLKIIFQKYSIDVHCTANGEEALSLLNKISILPDLIILDLQMPIMNGYLFRKEQLKNKKFTDIPVIVMSADDVPDLNEKMEFPQGVLIKPVQFDSLIKTVISVAPLLRPRFKTFQ